MVTPQPTVTQPGISDHERLQTLNDEVAIELLPVMIFLGILMVTGIVGNIINCYVFCFRLRMSTQHLLFVTLAAFDLLTCSVAMPAEIVLLRYYLTFESAVTCRLITFIRVYPAIVSALILLVIGVDRYLKICRPLAGQMSLRHTKMALMAVLFLAFILSVPMPLIYGIQTSNITDPRIQNNSSSEQPLQISFCSTDDSVKRTSYPLTYNIAQFVSFVVVVVVLITLYTKIWKRIKNLRHFFQHRTVHSVSGTCVFNAAATKETTATLSSESSSSTRSPISISTAQTSSSGSLYSVSSSPSAGQASSSVRSSTIATTAEHPSSSGRYSTRSKSHTSLSTKSSRISLSADSTSSSSPPRSSTSSVTARAKSYKTAMIAVSVTVVFFLSFLPYVVLVSFRAFQEEFDRSLRGARLVVYNVFLHFPYVNSVANPFIYGALNNSFRQQCAHLRQRLLCCFWKKA